VARHFSFLLVSARRFALQRMAERSYHRAMRDFNTAECDLRGPMSFCNGLRLAAGLRCTTPFGRSTGTLEAGHHSTPLFLQ